MRVDCSKTLNFLKETSRACESIEDCTDCPMFDDGVCILVNFMEFDKNKFAELITDLQKWSDEHPQKTIWDDFKEKFPNANERVMLGFSCPYLFGYEKDQPPECQSELCCRDCWSRCIDEVSYD